MVELRKRKAQTDTAPPPVKKASSVKSSSSNQKYNSAVTPEIVAAGNSIDLDSFGGEVETHDGSKVTLKQLIDQSNAGVVLFTYPKASTPGCTTQACLFRDDFASLTATGLDIFGLSTDSPKSNTNFKTKQCLPYTLLCDPARNLIAAIGMKKKPNGTIRGVFVVNKAGKVEAVSQGGPAATVDVVRRIVGEQDVSANADTAKSAEGEKVEKETEDGKTNAQEIEQRKVANGDEARADVAAEVADSAQMLDGAVEA